MALNFGLALDSFYHGPLAKQGDVVKVPQFSIIRGPLKVGEVSLTKLRPGLCQVAVQYSTNI